MDEVRDLETQIDALRQQLAALPVGREADVAAIRERSRLSREVRRLRRRLDDLLGRAPTFDPDETE